MLNPFLKGSQHLPKGHEGWHLCPSQQKGSKLLVIFELFALIRVDKHINRKGSKLLLIFELFDLIRVDKHIITRCSTGILPFGSPQTVLFFWCCALPLALSSHYSLLCKYSNLLAEPEYDYTGCLRALATNFKMTHCAPGDFIIRNLFVLLLIKWSLFSCPEQLNRWPCH